MENNKTKFIVLILFTKIFSFARHSEASPKGEPKNLDDDEILRSASPAAGRQGLSQNDKDKPNVIIITIDTLRADHVGCYGYYRNTTPNIDNFSKDAVIFKNAISQANYTLASMASFITSKYPNIHILFDFMNFKSENTGTCILNPYYPTLTKVLKKAGYSTFFISDHLSMFYIKGLKEGFDSFVESNGNNPVFLTKTALKWISGNKDKPFFIWVHYHGPHSPYHPNKAPSLNVPLKEKDKNIPLAKMSSEIFGFIPNSVRKTEDNNFNNLNYYINNYDGKILLTDEQIGVLLGGIKNLGLDKKSIIVVTSDHGEEFGEHNLYCSHETLHYNTLLHVPLLLKIPSQRPSEKIINETVGLIDVVPTLLDILKIKKLNFDGETLLPLINDSTGKEARKNKFIFTAISGRTSITCNGWKLIHNIIPLNKSQRTLANGRLASKMQMKYELYNLETDIYEQNDLSRQKTETFKSLQDVLNESEERSNQEIINKKLILFRERSDRNLIEPEKETEKLKALGYLN